MLSDIERTLDAFLSRPMWYVPAIALAATVWVIVMIASYIARHERQRLRYRILEALEKEGGLLLFEIKLLAACGDDAFEVRAELAALIAEGIVYRVPAVAEYAPDTISHRYFLVKEGE